MNQSRQQKTMKIFASFLHQIIHFSNSLQGSPMQLLLIGSSLLSMQLQQ
jgi:hypothetical protein